ncbi:hypothetical protein ACTFIV_003365 [Dictyostelium citrinum]
MLSRKLNFIILLVCSLFILTIKSSTNSNANTLELIVDSNKNNDYEDECGGSLAESCNNILDAMKYYKSFISVPENENSSLILKLIDGVYPGEKNYLYISIGLKISIQPYTPTSQNVIIDGINMYETLFDIDAKGMNEIPAQTFLNVSYISFINFANSAYPFFYSYSSSGTAKYYFENCVFLNSEYMRFLNYGESKQSLLIFSDSVFKNIKFTEYSFVSPNSSIYLYKTKFDKVSFDGSLIKQCLYIYIVYCNFNDVSYGNLIQNASFINAGNIVSDSVFNQISGPKTSTPLYLFELSNNEYSSNLIGNKFINNKFENFNGGFVNLFGAKASFISNTISINATSSTFIKSLNSNIDFIDNTFTNTKYLNDDQLIDCSNSTITFTNGVFENFEKSPTCEKCNLIIDSKEICSNTSTTSTGSSHTISSTTTGEDHPNDSIDSKSVSYILFALILVLIFLLNL